MKLIGKYKIGKLRFRWHFDFQASTSRRDILMDSECGCGRCNGEHKKPKPENKHSVLDTVRIIIDNRKKIKVKKRCTDVYDNILARLDSVLSRQMDKRQLRRKSR